jgi:hypothetical protein
MTATIPIVIVTGGDAGRFRSGCEHGGNVTGMTFLGTETVQKSLQLGARAETRDEAHCVSWRRG